MQTWVDKAVIRELWSFITLSKGPIDKNVTKYVLIFLKKGRHERLYTKLYFCIEFRIILEIMMWRKSTTPTEP
jgi:hypothetical protein